MLRNRIFLVIAVGLVPVAVAAVLGAYAVNDSHRADVARLEAAVLTETSQRVAAFMDGQVLAQTSILVPYGQGADVSTSAQKFALSNRLQVLPFLESLSYINMAGAELTRIDRANPDGYPTSSLRDLASSPEYLTGRSGNYYVSDITYASSGPVIRFASPFKDDRGNLVGVVAGQASLASLGDIIAEAGIGDTGYLYLIDAKGDVIAGGGPFADALNRGAGTSSVMNFPIVQDVANGKDLLAAADQRSYANIQGAPVVAAGKYLERYHWGLVAEWPTNEANAVVDDLFKRNAIELGAVLAIAFALAFLLAAYITRPLRKLEEGAARVAQGKFDQGVDIRTGDELERLGASFNDMVMGLKQLEQLKDEFVFIAAHELRTPVAAMKGYLTLILDGTTGAVTPETRAYIEKVIASDNRLVQLVNDLLEVARSQAGRLTIKVQPTDLAAAVRGVLDELKSLADEKSVTMAYDVPADLPLAMADGDRVKEVMVNLVGNAIKYMGGPGSVTVFHEVKDGMVLTHVADTGLGMSGDAQAKLFEKFYRIQTERTRDITGTGLGLFIVRQIIEKMNGKIWVASEEGKGSTFSFSLPSAPRA